MMMLLMAALAEPYTPLAPALTDWHPSPDTYEQRLEIAAGQAPLGTTHIELFATGPDGVRRPYSSYLPVLPAPVQKDRPAPTGPPADVAGSTQGGLSGRAVYLSQCHGWIYFETLNAFSTQRGNLFDTVEDFHNPEGMNQYLIPMLENAGANLFTVKERDNNPLMSIVDNGGEGYVEDGSGFEDGPAGFAPNGPWEYGENPFDAGGTRRFPADNGGRVVWTPEVPRDGQYVVYVSWESDPENSETAHYRIHHPGGVIDRLFDQTVHGSTWQYVERLWLPEGIGGLTVELMGDGTTPGRWLSADAVRIGGGFSDVIRQGNVSLRPRWEEGAIQ